MKKILLSFMITITAGCAAQEPKATSSDYAERLDSATSQLMALPVEPQSVFKKNGTLHFQLGGGQNSVQASASCSTSDTTMDYLDLSTKGRVYAKSGSASYAPPLPLGKKASDELRRNVSYQGLCDSIQPPALKIISQSDQSWVMIDINSVHTLGKKKQAWIVYDYPMIAFDMPYNAPYSQKYENTIVNCTDPQTQTLAGYDVDDDGNVTDGNVGSLNNPIGTYSPFSSKDDKKVFEALCHSSTNELEKLADYHPRKKQPVSTEIPSIEPQSLQAIEKLGIPPAKKHFSHLRLSQTAKSQELSISSSENLYIKKQFPLYSQTQLLGIGPGISYTTTANSFEGLIDLSSKSTFHIGEQESTETSQITQLSFSGDWKDLPVGSNISYQKKEKSYDSVAGQLRNAKETVSHICHVQAEISAATLHPELTGSAKKVSCVLEGDKEQSPAIYYYLEDYRYFLLSSSSSSTSGSTTHSQIDSVE